MKKLGDILTVLLLLAAFGMAYYTGFVGKSPDGSPMLATNMFAIVSMAGAAVLFVVGAVSAMVSRVKNNLVTLSFTVLCCVQVFAVIGMCTIMTMLWTGMFALDNSVIRALYIIFTLIITMGYVDALLFSDNIAIKNGDDIPPEDDEEEEESDDEDAADELEEAEESAEEATENSEKKGMFLGF